jgi:thioester reductase-like protein
MAEALVRRAHDELGLNVSIYRPGMICGHSQTGFCHTTDFLPRYLRGITTLGSAMDHDGLFELVPVDSTASTIIKLSLFEEQGISGKTFALAAEMQREESKAKKTNSVFIYEDEESDVPLPRTYHVANCHDNLMSWRQIGEAVRAAGFKDLVLKRHAAWIQLLAEAQNNPLYPVFSIVKSQRFWASGLERSCQNTLTVMQYGDMAATKDDKKKKQKKPPEFKFPKCTEQLIQVYMKRLVGDGLVAKPGTEKKAATSEKKSDKAKTT